VYVVGENKRFFIPLGSEKIYLTVRDPKTEEHVAFMNERYAIVGKDVRENLMGASVRFIDKILVDVEGIGYKNGTGDVHKLTNKVKDWKDKVPAYFKRTIATVFETAAGAVLEEAKPT